GHQRHVLAERERDRAGDPVAVAARQRDLRGRRGPHLHEVDDRAVVGGDQHGAGAGPAGGQRAARDRESGGHRAGEGRGRGGGGGVVGPGRWVATSGENRVPIAIGAWGCRREHAASSAAHCPVSVAWWRAPPSAQPGRAAAGRARTGSKAREERIYRTNATPP